MAIHFWDSSGLVKRYIIETRSVWTENLFHPALANDHFITAVTPVEIVAAITRRGRGGTLSPVDAAAACADFHADLLNDYQLVELTDILIAHAMGLAENYGLRGYDAVQLAAAMELNDLCIHAGMPPIRFISADQELIAVALRKGLNTDDPNTHP